MCFSPVENDTVGEKHGGKGISERKKGLMISYLVKLHNLFDTRRNGSVPILYSMNIFCLSFFVGLVSLKINAASNIGIVHFLASLLVSFLILLALNRKNSGLLYKYRETSKEFHPYYYWYLSSIILLFMMPLFLLYPEHSALRGYAVSFLLLTFVACALFLRWLLVMARSEFESLLLRVKGVEKITIFLSVGFYILFLFTLAEIKYLNFGGYCPDDAAFYKFFLNISKGIWHGPVFRGTTLLAWHADFLIYPFALLFSIWPYYETFLLIKVGMLGLSAIPLYLIIRDEHNSLSVILIVASYLLFFQIAGASVWDFHEVVFAPFFLLLTFYFYKNKKFGWFMFFMVLSLLLKENISIVVFSFSVYGLMEKRGLKWLFAPLVSSMFWLFLSMKVLLPYFGSNHYIHPKCIDNILGYVKNPFNIIKAFTNPRMVAKVYTFFQPFLFIFPFFGKEIVLVLPWFLLALFIGGNEQIRTWHYLIIIGYVFVALSSSLARLRTLGNNDKVVVFITILIFFVSVSCSIYWFRVEDFIAKPYKNAQKMAIDLIPEDSSVCAPASMQVYLQEKKMAFNELSFKKERPVDIDFIIFDSHINRYYFEARGKDVTPQFIRELRKLAPRRRPYRDYEFYWEKEGIFIYKNKSYKFQL